MTSVQAAYAPVNGLELYYEISGSGTPLIVLHGGFMTIKAMGELIPALARTRQVIAVELQGHGHTALSERPFTIEAMADDIGGLIEQLNLEQADILGFSMGGEVAQQTAIRHPEKVGKLVLISAPCAFEDWYPEVQAGMAQINAEFMRSTMMYDVYASVAPHVEDWDRFVGSMHQLMTTDHYNWRDQIAALDKPILLIAGDADSISPASMVAFFALLGGGKGDAMYSGRPAAQLAMLPGSTHINIIDRVELLLGCIEPFLEHDGTASAPFTMEA